jgi:hypothetical protein
MAEFSSEASHWLAVPGTPCVPESPRLYIHGVSPETAFIVYLGSGGLDTYPWKTQFKHPTTSFNFVEEMDCLPEVGWEAQNYQEPIQTFNYFVETSSMNRWHPKMSNRTPRAA